MKLFKCLHCGNVATKVYDSGVPLVCCGENMVGLKANSEEAATEKHIPVLSVEGDILTVKVGEVPHPMTPQHYITTIVVVNGERNIIVVLDPSDLPQATVQIDPSQPIKAYEYCNVHGLWTASL